MRAVAALLAVHTLLLASGAPLPLGLVASWVPAGPVKPGDDAQRFPCEACPCGCNTAEHCWSKCCCHTPAQRLAWAHREGVRPPDSALDAAEAAGLDVSHWRPNRGPRRYTVSLPQTVEAEPDLDSLPPCCRAARLRARKQAENPAPATPPKREPAPGVSLMQAAACQGLAEAWLSLGDAPLPEPVEPIAPAIVRYGASSPTLPAESHNEAPTPPPPRFSRAA